MGGSLEWVTCPVCEYKNACADFEMKDRKTYVYCAECGYDSRRGYNIFYFLYRNEFRITVVADDLEEAYVKAQTGGWANVTLVLEALHCGMLEEVD